MEEIVKNILFIDDQYESYLPVLEPVANESGYAISVYEKITEGLIFLDAYSAVTDVVILDLSFPTGEMQGKEGLQDIIRLFPHIPVIILTDSDSADDLGNVVECMKIGAYNYVGKSTLNPVYLFQVINKAVDDYRRKKYMIETKKTSDDKELFHTVIQKFSAASESYQAIFGFELLSVARASAKENTEALYKRANSWHNKLLKAINTPYKDTLKINLRYISGSNRQVICRIFFSVYAENQTKLSYLISNVQEDIKRLFMNESHSNEDVYSFYNINDDSILLDAITYRNDHKYFVACRKPVPVNLSNQIGFATANSSSENPNLIFPFHSPDIEPNEFIKVLSKLQQGTAIDIELHARNLKISEINILKHIIRSPGSIPSAAYGSKDETWLKQFLSEFTERANEKCFISLMIIHKDDQLNHTLKTAVSDSFLGRDADFQIRTPDNLMRFVFDSGKPENQLPFCYSLSQALQAFRFPLPDGDKIEGINQQLASFTFLPDNLPDKGFCLGEKFLQNGKKEIKVDSSILSRHLYIMGQTGTGKSTMLKTMISGCVDQNKGFALIDPHGDLFQDIIEIIPEEKKHKIITIDTVNPENSAKYNPLRYDPEFPQTKSLIINELLRITDNLYDLKTTGGPMFELYFRHGLLLVMNEKVQEISGEGTMETFNKIFYDRRFCETLLDICSDTKTVDFFKNALEIHGDISFQNIANYITSKMSRFTDDLYISKIIKGDADSVNLRQLIDDERILLIKMDKGLIGSTNASFLGQLIISSILNAAMSRSDIARNQRKPFYLFIDEFQNFIQGDVGTAMAEARKYNLGLVMANQTLGQLNQHVLESLLGNVGSFAFFRPGINDYEKIKHYIEPEFERRDVLKLPNFNCIGRLLIDNIPSDPFVFQTIN